MIKTGKEKLVSDVATTLRYGCRLSSDWLYIPIRFQHSAEDHTHNAQQEREEGRLSGAHHSHCIRQTVISIFTPRNTERRDGASTGGQAYRDL